MFAREQLDGFYGVLDRDDPALANALIAGGACALQVRLKPRAGSDAPAVTAADLTRVATWARALCTAHGIALIVNDRIDIALAVNADGVHLGQLDLPITEARKIVGDRLWIGISTHDLDQVCAAVAGGADYLGYGPVYATSTKANPDRVQGLAALEAAVKTAGDIPVVAIGGILPGFAHDIYGTGAAALCAISAVNDAPDVEAAARECAPRFQRVRS